jgi:TetR/AcrR family fatty acid metabolism transcriptional regulator
MSSKAELQNNKKEKEAAIFDAACRVIRQKGFHQARMADIAHEAGISYGLVYHYFGSKADLFDALIEEWWGGLFREMDRLAEGDFPVERRLGGIAEYFLDQFTLRPDLVHLFITEFSRSSANLTPERLMYFKKFMDRTEAIIRKGQESGHIRSDLKARYLRYAFLGSVEALLSAMVLENQAVTSDDQRKRLARAVLTMFLEGARPPSL